MCTHTKHPAIANKVIIKHRNNTCCKKFFTWPSFLYSVLASKNTLPIRNKFKGFQQSFTNNFNYNLRTHGIIQTYVYIKYISKYVQTRYCILTKCTALTSLGKIWVDNKKISAQLKSNLFPRTRRKQGAVPTSLDYIIFAVATYVKQC